MSTCNWLDFQTLVSQPTKPKISPDTDPEGEETGAPCVPTGSLHSFQTLASLPMTRSLTRSWDQMQYCISTSRTYHTPLHLNYKAKKRHLRSHGCWYAMSWVLQVRELECCWWSMNFGVPPATFTLHSTTNQFRYICSHHRIQLSASTWTISTHPWPRQDILLRLEIEICAIH